MLRPVQEVMESGESELSIWYSTHRSTTGGGIGEHRTEKQGMRIGVRKLNKALRMVRLRADVIANNSVAALEIEELGITLTGET